MKRNEVEPGGDYVTEADVLVRIKEDEEPTDNTPEAITAASGTSNGWGIARSLGHDPEWVEAKVYGKRYMGNGSFQEYQSNPDVRCYVLGHYQADGTLIAYDEPFKDVVSPRDLSHPVSQHAEVLKARKTQERTAAQRQKGITSALKKAGIDKAKVNLDKNEVTVNLSSLMTALKIEV